MLELSPEEFARLETSANAQAEQIAKKRLAKDRWIFAQGLAAGIAGTVIVMVAIWSLFG